MKTILIISSIVWLAGLFLAASVEVASAQATLLLGWDANVESTCTGYRILSGPASRTYIKTNTIPGRTTIGGSMVVPPGTVYLAVVAFDASGLDSDFSNELVWTNRLAAPKNFKLTGTIQAGRSPTGPWTNIADLNIAMPPVPTNQTASFFRSTLLLKELP